MTTRVTTPAHARGNTSAFASSYNPADVDLLLVYKRSATVFTIGVSLFFLVRLWGKGELRGPRGVIFCAWFLVAASAQTLSPSLGVSMLGLVAQLILAIVLILKQQLSDIT